MHSVWFAPETAIVVSVAVLILVGFCRGFSGGSLFDPDKSVRDGIAGVVIYIFAVLWYCLMFFEEGLIVWSEQPLGKLAMSMAMIGIMMSRMNTLWRSARNRK